MCPKARVTLSNVIALRNCATNHAEVISKFKTALSELDYVLDSIHSVIQESQGKVQQCCKSIDDLQRQLNILESRKQTLSELLATTEPIIYVRETYEDENGSHSYVSQEPNPVYEQYMSEYNSVVEKISRGEDIMRQLEGNFKSLDGLITYLSDCSRDISAIRQSMSESCDRMQKQCNTAVRVLSKAANAIQAYMSESISGNSGPIDPESNHSLSRSRACDSEFSMGMQR